MARAIVVPPEILLCDEPTSALDVSLAATVLNLLGRLRRELGIAMLFVTHDLAAARFVADRIAVMYLGPIVEIGPADEVASNPSTPTPRRCWPRPSPATRAGQAGRASRQPARRPPGCAFHPRCPDRTDRCTTEAPILYSLDGTSSRFAACLLTEADRDGSERAAS